ncbi:MAG: ATP-binding protein [Bacilli bacterium]|nr:ATP-binding protein [Bacilli bacterium]
MLLYLDFNGYRFFDNTKISFCADARIKRLLSNSEFIDGRNVLKTIGLYGANNSGKSNIYDLFVILKQVLLGKEVIFNNPIFDDYPKINISLIFNNLNGNGWYKYEFIFDNDIRSYEYEAFSLITFYNGGSMLKKAIFEKDIVNKKLLIKDEDYSDVLSIIPSKFPLLYSIKLDEGKLNYLRKYLIDMQLFGNSIETIQMFNIPMDNTLNAMKSDNEEKKKFINEFVKKADISINSFKYDDKSQYKLENKNISELALQYLTINPDIFKFITIYDNKPVPSLIFDSTGTKKIEAIASYVYDALKLGKLLVIDEIDNGLHYKLTRSLISIFNNMINKSGQLFFITHDLLLIDSKTLMRKDQIYLIDRNEKKATVKSLKDFPVDEGGPREVSDFIKQYNRGGFGNVPNPNFIAPILEILNGQD